MGRGRGRRFSCTDCREESMNDPYVCQNCFKEDSGEPFKCRRCKYVGLKSKPFVCQDCNFKGPKFIFFLVKSWSLSVRKLLDQLDLF